MKTSKPLDSSFPLEEYSRRTVRAWWADGFWDLALAGLWILAALWSYPLVRTLDFPSWTWPWPFITREHINPLGTEIAVWAFVFVLLLIVYAILAKLLIDRLKRRFIAPRLGDVRYKLFLPMERKFALLFLAFYVLVSFLVVGLFWKIKGGPHFFSSFVIASFAVVLLLLGRRYHLRRYIWTALVGTALCTLAELLTTTAVYLDGPKNFLDVSPFYGNPSLVCLVWAGMIFLNGAVTLRRTLRLPYAEV